MALSFAQTRSIEATPSLTPSTAKLGENKLEIVLSENGKPVTGIKFVSSVSMTNMDMGTAHPEVTEVSAGHYELKVRFSMSGSWMVSLQSKTPKMKVSWDFEVGDKKPWIITKKIIRVDESHTENEIDMNTPGINTTSQPSQHLGHAKTSSPLLRESKTYEWGDKMNFETRTGFGKMEPLVRMMILMMVGGSGFEGMKMEPVEIVFNDSTYLEEAIPPKF